MLERGDFPGRLVDVVVNSSSPPRPRRRRGGSHVGMRPKTVREPFKCAAVAVTTFGSPARWNAVLWNYQRHEIPEPLSARDLFLQPCRGVKLAGLAIRSVTFPRVWFKLVRVRASEREGASWGASLILWSGKPNMVPTLKCRTWWSRQCC